MIRKMLWGVVIGLLTLIIVPHVLSQTVHVIEAPLEGAKLAVTVCDGNVPIIVIDPRVPSEIRHGVLEHEKIHVSQIRRYKNCHEFYKKFNADGDFRFKMELEAYCPALRELRASATEDFIVNRFLRFIRPLTSPEADDGELRAQIHFCLRG